MLEEQGIDSTLKPGTTATLTKIILPNLLPDERLLWLGKEHYGLGMIVEIFTLGMHGSGLVFIRNMGETGKFGKPNWHDVFRLTLLIVVLGLVIILLLTTTYNPAYKSIFNQPCLIFLVPAMFFAIRILAEHRFAITNKRLICISLFEKKIFWWINLDNLNVIESMDRKNGVKDLKFKFSQHPTGMSGRQLSIDEFTLLGIDEIEKVKSLIASQVIKT